MGNHLVDLPLDFAGFEFSVPEPEGPDGVFPRRVLEAAIEALDGRLGASQPGESQYCKEGERWKYPSHVDLLYILGSDRGKLNAINLLARKHA